MMKKLAGFGIADNFLVPIIFMVKNSFQRIPFACLPVQIIASL
jgi:hypothetical protein